MPEYRLTRLRGKWAVAIHQDGKRIQRITLGTSNRSEAERLLKTFIAGREKPTSLTVSSLWEQYRADHADKRIAENMVYSGKAILPILGNLLPDEINASACREYIAARSAQGRKVGTIWTELNHLQIVLNWSYKNRLIPHAITVQRPPKPPPRDRRLTRTESRALLDAPDYPHISLAIALMLYTGARIGAILDLTWDRVDFAANQITYANPDDPKRRKGRATVPMVPDLRNRMLEAQAGAISPHVVEWAGRQVGSIKRGFARAVERAGLEAVTPHVLRHTAACLMAEQRVPMSEIAAVLGHSDSRTTERIYAKYSPDYLTDAIAALDLSGVPSGSGVTNTVNKKG